MTTNFSEGGYLSHLRKQTYSIPPIVYTIATFVICMAHFWRNRNIFVALPHGGDSLEVIWGILWYNNALTELVNPFYYPFIFHPEGWPVGILAHTPLLFLIAQPFYLLGGEVFAFNSITLLSFVVAYTGSLKYFSIFIKKQFPTLIIAAAFTFISMRSFRAFGHLNILWATSLLPYFAYHVQQWYLQKDKKMWHIHLVWAGIYWGLMISFSLYSLFLGPLIFLLLERKLFCWKTYIQIPFTIFTALAIGSSSILPYYLSSRTLSIQSPAFENLVSFGSSLNNTFIPSISHPVPLINHIANSIQSNSLGENELHNIGLITLVIILFITLFRFTQSKSRGVHIYYGHVILFLISFSFAMGPILKINNEPLLVNSPALETINLTLWRVGNQLKPDVFLYDQIPLAFTNSIPLPGYLLTVFMPFWESARVSARFAYLTLFGALGIIATGLETWPLRMQWLKWLIILLWIIELIPNPTDQIELSINDIHPSYQWIIDQSLPPDKGIIEVSDKIMHSAVPLYLSWQTKIPSASATASFRLEHTQFLYDQVGSWTDKPPEFLANMLATYDVQFVVVHNINEDSQQIWEYLTNNSNDFVEVGCFPPGSYPVCIAEINNSSTYVNIFPTSGFFSTEPEGIWISEEGSTFDFIATSAKDYLISFGAFPVCADDKFQSMSWHAEEELLFEYSWTDCKTTSAEITIPKEHIHIGWNEVRIRIDYVADASIPNGENNRTWGIGFEDFKVRPLTSQSD